MKHIFSLRNMDSQKKDVFIKLTMSILFILLSVWILGLLSTYTHAKKEDLFLTPTVSDACGWDIYTLENGSQKTLAAEEVLELEPGKTFYLSRTLTQEQEDAGYAYLLLADYRPHAVFLDGELLYTNCPDSVSQMDDISFPDSLAVTTPRGMLRCCLPQGFAGKELTIATAQVFSEYGNSMPGVTLSSYAIESENLAASVCGELLPAAGLSVITLFLSGVWLFAFFQGVRDYPSLLLILSALIQALSHLRQLVFLLPVSAATAMDTPLALFVPVIETLLPLIWLFLQMDAKKHRMIFGCILGVCAAVSLIAPTAGLFGGLPFYSSFLANNEVLYVPLISFFVFAVLEVRQGNTKLRLFLSEFCIAILCIVLLYIGSLFGKRQYADYIAVIFKLLPERAPADFFRWSAVLLFLLSAILSLYQILRRMTQIQTDLALSTERAKQLDSLLSAQKEFYEAKLSHEEEIRSLRHDMAGHLSTLARLFDEQKLEEAGHYLNGIAEYHSEQTGKIYSDNPYINAILQNYAAKCLEHQIAFKCHIGVKEEELPATELCLILNNALENAVEASLALPETDRKVTIQAAVQQNMFLLRVSNRFDGGIIESHTLPDSTKKGKEHGYGLSNIRRAAERKDGSMEYHIQDGYFVLDVIFAVN